MLRHTQRLPQTNNLLLRVLQLRNQTHLFACVEEGGGDSFHSLHRGSTGEVTGPVAVLPMGVGEKVVRLDRPRLSGLVECIEIAGGIGVEEIHFGPIRLLQRTKYVPHEEWCTSQSNTT